MGIKILIITKISYKSMSVKSGTSVKSQGAISSEAAKGGVWTSYSNIDMCLQGDVEIIGEWKKKYSIEELKRMVEEKNYSCFTVSAGQPSFGHATLKKFDFNVTPA